MNQIRYILILLFSFTIQWSFAGNPDRQGQAGAGQLLINPWASSAGLHGMNTANISGVASMRVNIAGISRIARSEFVFGHTSYLQGTDIGINAFGFSQKMGKSGALGVSLMAMDYGKLPVTTTDQPEGTGATFTPTAFNLGIGYSHMFENKVSVGILFRAISETTSDLRAFGLAIDAGVQYVTGPQDNFKFGISLRNVGSPMRFSGEGLATSLEVSDGGHVLPFSTRAEKFELPSALNIGLSYDFVFAKETRLSVLGNFTSNSFSQDQIGGGVEFSLNSMFALRGGYKLDLGQIADGGERAPLYAGPSAGVSVLVPMKKESSRKVGLDYAYRNSQPLGGSHSISIKISL